MKPGPREGFRWTRETIIYAFELWHRRYLCSPTVAEWRRAGERQSVGDDRAQRLRLVEQRRQGGRAPAAAAGRAAQDRLAARRSSAARGRHALAADASRRAPAAAGRTSTAGRRRSRNGGAPGRGIRPPRPSAASSAAGTPRSSRPASRCAPPGVPVEPRSITHARCEKTGRWTARAGLTARDAPMESSRLQAAARPKEAACTRRQPQRDSRMSRSTRAAKKPSATAPRASPASRPTRA